MLVIAAMNLKQMAAWLWKTGRTSLMFSFEFVNMVKKRRELGRVAGLIGRIPEIS